MADNVFEITDDNYETEVTDSEIPVLLDFWADWCGPCKMLAPTIHELADLYVGKIKVGKLNTDDNRETAVKFSINAIPTIAIIKNGQLIKKVVGMTSKKDLISAIDEVI